MARCEYAAAAVAGAVTPEEGIRLISSGIVRDVKFPASRIPHGFEFGGRRVRSRGVRKRHWHFAGARGCEGVIEIGPHPVLTALGKASAGDYGVWVSSLRQGEPDWIRMCGSLASLYTGGASIDWRGFDKKYSRQKVSLPLYPFRRDRYWVANAEKLLPWDAERTDDVYEVRWQAVEDVDVGEESTGGCLVTVGEMAPEIRGWTHKTIPEARGCEEALEIVQSWDPAAGRLWFATRGAQPVEGPVTAPDQAALHGLGKVIALEHPELWGGDDRSRSGDAGR